MWIWIVLGVVVLVAIGAVVSYNRFISQKNLDQGRVGEHRHGAAASVRPDPEPGRDRASGYATHEREVFENVTKARAMATAATGSPAEQAAAEGPLVAALRQLFAVVENYPDLKANQNFLALQAELSNTEDRLQTARRFYNANVRDYNRRVKQFPSVLDREHVRLQGRGVLRGRGGDPRGWARRRWTSRSPGPAISFEGSRGSESSVAAAGRSVAGRSTPRAVRTADARPTRRVAALSRRGRSRPPARRRTSDAGAPSA